MRGRGVLIPPNPCITFTYRARSKIFASIFSFLISSHLARSARSGAFHSLLSRRGGYFLQWLSPLILSLTKSAPYGKAPARWSGGRNIFRAHTPLAATPYHFPHPISIQTIPNSYSASYKMTCLQLPPLGHVQTAIL